MGMAGELGLRLAGAAAILAALSAFFWDLDRRLTGGAGLAVSQSLAAGRRPGPGQTAALSAELLRGSIGPRPVGALALHILQSSLVALLVLAIVALMTTPDHLATFLGTWESVRRFVAILLLNGLTSVFLAGYAAAAVIGPLAPRIAACGPAGAAGFVLAELAVRLAALVLVTAGTYVLFARIGGSFGGSWRTALAVIPETLALALRGHSLASVVTYAALLGGLPLQVVLLVKLAGSSPGFPALWRGLGRLVPLDGRPVRFFGILLAILAAAAALVASLVP
jgi:hypothetical protein